MMFALVDCNNFYPSCERVFNPKLEGRPIIVLSNNDGCAIARSEEAKALGVQMGTPAHMIGELIEQRQIQVFSSNYELYGDLSNRVMTILGGFVPQLECYSIDEAFLDMNHMAYDDLQCLGISIRKTIKQHTGIPVSVGIAPTKTLAKMANRFVKKKKTRDGVHWLESDNQVEEVLRFTEVGDIWGIGPERATLCLRGGFKTAFDLSLAPDDWVLNNMTVVGLRLVHELRGIPCIAWELEPPPKKHIGSSRSFGTLMTRLIDLQQAVANYMATCAQKLRRQKSCAQKIHVFLQTNPFRTEDKQYFRSITMPLPVPTSSTPDLVHHALKALGIIFKPQFHYLKVGVVTLDLVPEGQRQSGIFDRLDRGRDKTIMGLVDSVNGSLGKDLVRFAVQGFENRYQLRAAHVSPRYTTRITDIVKIKD
jgi:DNA polymerase V